ncbi:MAG: ethanolamine utilization protein EutH [Butyricicoccus sp.]|nr:ethanolamine utilization protein EutH [Butyricicoccus sp.]
MLGLIDLILGGRWGLGAEFEQGVAKMGSIALSMVGFYCIGITFVQQNAALIAEETAGMPFDPSMLIALVLCSDMGGLPIAQELAATPELGIFTGALVASGMGAMVSFQLPVFLSTIPKEHLPTLMRGFVYGIVTLPIGLLTGGLMLGLPLQTLLVNMMPVLALCLVLLAGMKWSPDGTVRVLIRIGRIVSILSYALFGLVVIGLFLPQFAIAEQALVEEAAFIALRAVIIVSGGMVLSHLAVRFFHGALDSLSRLLGINYASVMGLILSCPHSMAMVPMYPDMDRKGQIMNAAFSVCGAYLIGGQLAFVMQLVPASAVPAVLANKILAGVSAVVLAAWAERNSKEA